MQRAIEKKNPRVILLDPAGRTFDQAYAEELAQEERNWSLSVVTMRATMSGSRPWWQMRFLEIMFWWRASGHDYDWCDSPQFQKWSEKESSHQDDSFSSGLLENILNTHGLMNSRGWWFPMSSWVVTMKISVSQLASIRVSEKDLILYAAEIWRTSLRKEGCSKNRKGA